MRSSSGWRACRLHRTRRRRIEREAARRWRSFPSQQTGLGARNPLGNSHSCFVQELRSEFEILEYAWNLNAHARAWRAWDVCAALLRDDEADRDVRDREHEELTCARVERSARWSPHASEAFITATWLSVALDRQRRAGNTMNSMPLPRSQWRVSSSPCGSKLQRASSAAVAFPRFGRIKTIPAGSTRHFPLNGMS